MAAELPVASPIPKPVVKPTKRAIKKVEPVVPVEPEPVEEEEEEEDVMVKKSEYKALLARIEALEVSKKESKESVKKSGRAPRIPTKDVVLRDILEDGEKVYAKELINDGDEKGTYMTWTATFHTLHNGFLIDEVNNEGIWSLKRAYATSPTTLCSRFRFLMKQSGQCVRGASTCCGFAKCYVIRDGNEMRLNTLW